LSRARWMFESELRLYRGRDEHEVNHG